MRKVSLLSAIIVIFIAFSCGFKDKLMNNAISVTIKPGAVDSIPLNSSQEFTAFIRDPRGKLMDVDANWNISGFSSDVSISTNIGKSIIFYAGNTESKGVLTAEYDGARRFVTIEIKEIKNENTLILYNKNGKLSDKIDEEDLIYIDGDGNPSDYITIKTVDENGEKCFELIVKQPTLGQPVGFYLEFKTHEDLSKFTTLHFSIRSSDANPNISFNIYAINETDDDNDGYRINGDFRTVGQSFDDIGISISNVSRDNTKEILAIEFTKDDIMPSPRKVRLKNIYLD
jgi:hypothetical protein